MATTVDIAGTSISASQLNEFFRLVALPDSHINRKTLQAFLEKRSISANKDVKDMLRLAGIIDRVRFEFGVSEEAFRILWTPEGRPHIEKMFEALCQQPNVSCYPVLAETRLLKPVSSATVLARAKPFVASELYRTGTTGLYVYDTVVDRLDLNARKTVASAPKRPYVGLLLKARANDTDIRKELPKMHLSTPEDITELIVAQPNGKSGFLLNNGLANNFYVKDRKNGVVFVRRVIRSPLLWHIVDFGLDEGGDPFSSHPFLWDAGILVLCPGNAVL